MCRRRRRDRTRGLAEPDLSQQASIVRTEEQNNRRKSKRWEAEYWMWVATPFWDPWRKVPNISEKKWCDYPTKTVREIQIIAT